MPDHAFLSASSSHRWLECPPSAKLCAEHPGRGSPFSQQGTDAHTLAAYKLEKALGRKPKDPTEDLNWFDAEMADCTDAYADFVMEQLAEAKEHCPDPLVQVEQKVSFSRWVPEGYGTADACIIADGTMYVIDLKYGTGVLVDADWNPQIMCYALGLLEAYDGIYDIQKIRMTIFQPRRENVTTFGLTKEQLLGWAENSLAPRAQLAWNGEGNFRAGSHCQFCTVKAICRKRAEYNLEMARYDFEMPDTLNGNEIAAILPRIDQLAAWGNDVKEYALEQALAGKHFDGYKIVAGRSVSRYANDEAVARAVLAAGEDPWEKKLLGITAMRAMLGRKRFDELLGGMVIKPPGKPTLVPETDKRPAIDPAAADFKNEQGEKEP